MKKKQFDIFNFFRSCVQFFQIVVIFFLMLNLLYWIQHLIGLNLAWMNFAHPVLDWYIDTGAKISDGSIDIMGTVFEYKYILATSLYIITYFLVNFLNPVINEIEYQKTVYKKQKEASFNKALLQEQTAREVRVNKYKILVKTSIKKQFANANFGYTLEEQNRIMNKFLVEKTGVQPDVLEYGFLYSFSHFNKIDTILEIFFRLLKSNAPLDYVICVQTMDKSESECLNKIKMLAELKITNKITMLAETAYRYSFNETALYKTVILGEYQKPTGSIEVCGFVE